MAYKLSDALAQSNLNGPGFKPSMDGNFLHFFAGPVPESPAEALDMVSSHTLLGTASVNGDGVTGLTFDAAVGDVLQKAAAEAWGGTFTFSGAQDAEPSLLATFIRMAPTTDDCQGAGAGPRLQGTVTANGGGGDLERADPNCTNGQPFNISGFVVRVGSLS